MPMSPSSLLLWLCCLSCVAALVVPPPGTHATVVFLRHGQSTWNAASLFTGWADVELSTLGKNEAATAATDLWKEGFEFDVAYSSRLRRAKQTLDMVLRISGQEDVPCNRCWRLNERMYGGLTGLNKVETAEKFGADQVKIWRRSYDTPPPEVDLDSEYYPGTPSQTGPWTMAAARCPHGLWFDLVWTGNDAEYLHIPIADIPRAESLKDCIARTLPYWQSDITPALKRGKTVLIAAHGNSIRGMLKYLDDISDDEILSVEVPTAIPLVYHLDADLKPLKTARSPTSGPLSGYFLGEASEANDPQKSHGFIAEPEDGMQIGRTWLDIKPWHFH